MTTPRVYEPEGDPEYSIEFIAKATGLSSETILHYQEEGWVRAHDGRFDDEALLTLRRIEHLRREAGVGPAGLKLIMELIGEVERLRAAVRARR